MTEHEDARDLAREWADEFALKLWLIKDKLTNEPADEWSSTTNYDREYVAKALRNDVARAVLSPLLKRAAAAEQRVTELEEEKRTAAAEALDEAATNPDVLEPIRKKIEDVLIERRDGRISMMLAANGLVIREKDGKDSSMVRITTPEVLRIAFRTLAAQHRKEQPRV